MAERSEERLAISEFEKYLRRTFPESNIVVEHNVNDPPDYFCEVNGLSYAVEITQLENFRMSLTFSEISMEDKSNGFIKKLAQRINESFKAHGGVQGQWGLSTYDPIPPERINRAQFGSLLGQALDAINKGDTDIILFDDDANRLATLRLIDPNGSRIWPLFIVTEWPESDEYLDRRRTAYVNALKRKWKALQRIPKPWVLILLDVDGMADTTHYQMFARESPLSTEFHGIYRIVGRPSGFVVEHLVGEVP